MTESASSDHKDTRKTRTDLIVDTHADKTSVIPSLNTNNTCNNNSNQLNDDQKSAQETHLKPSLQTIDHRSYKQLSDNQLDTMNHVTPNDKINQQMRQNDTEDELMDTQMDTREGDVIVVYSFNAYFVVLTCRHCPQQSSSF